MVLIREIIKIPLDVYLNLSLYNEDYLYLIVQNGVIIKKCIGRYLGDDI